MAHDHAHDDHEPHEHGEEDRRIRLLHGASPYCWWSFGYEGVLNRMKLLYGDQIKVNTYQIPVYNDRDEHHRGYGTDDPKVMEEWIQEAEGFMGLPIDRAAVGRQPTTCVPGTMMVHAAEVAKAGAGEKLARLIGFHANSDMAGLDLEDEPTLLKLAEKVGAPRKQVEQALADGRAEASLREDMQSMHALGLNYFSLQCRDFEGRTVILEYAFDSAKVEEALEWLARGKLRKHSLPQPGDYALAHAPVSLRELQEVFRLDPAKAKQAMEPLEKAGKLARREVQGHPFWFPRAWA